MTGDAETADGVKTRAARRLRTVEWLGGHNTASPAATPIPSNANASEPLVGPRHVPWNAAGILLWKFHVVKVVKGHVQKPRGKARQELRIRLVGCRHNTISVPRAAEDGTSL